MIKYILGFLYFLFNFRISFFALIDIRSRIHKKARIHRGCKIFNSTIGAYTYVAPNSTIVFANIGKFCSIAQNVNIGLGKHNTKTISTSPIFYSSKNALGISWVDNNKFEEYKTVTIGNDVWLGMNVIIKDAIKIGDGAVVAAGAVVTKDIPPYAIVAGVPAKIIKYRFSPETIRLLIDSKWWNRPDNILKSNINLFSIEDEENIVKKIDF